jgi:hypothetical protein
MTKLGGAAMLAKGSIVAALALSVADMNKGNKPKNTAQLTDTVNFLKPGTTALKEKTDATKAGTDATKAMSAADKDSAAAAKLQAQYEADSATQIAAAAKAALSLKTGLADLNAQTLDVKDSQLAFLDSISSLTNGLATNGTSLSDNTEAGRKNEEGLLTSIKAAQAHAVALETSGVSAISASKAYLSDEAALRKAATAAGLSKGEVDKLIKTYGGVPSNITTQIKAETAWANRQVGAFATHLSNIPTTHTTTMKVSVGNSFDVINSVIDYANSANPVIHVTTRTAAGAVSGGRQVAGATGGIVTRPTHALIGEAGPEMVVPLNRTPGSSPLPSSFGNSHSSPTVNVYVNAGTVVANKWELGRTITAAIAEYTSGGGALVVSGKRLH